LARKADLRPSPLSTHLSHDLLTIKSEFHVNFLPEMLETFRGLFAAKESLGIGEFEVETVVKPAIRLDGQLAYQDSIVELLEAARITSFPSANRLHFPNPITQENFTKTLHTFHHETLQRAGTSHQQNYTLLLSVNDQTVLDANKFEKCVKDSGFPLVEAKNDLVSPQEEEPLETIRYGQGVRIENGNLSAEYLLAYPIKNAGFAQSKNHHIAAVLEALVKKQFPSTCLSSTADSALLSIHFESSEKLKEALQVLKNLQINDEAINWAIQRAKFNQIFANDSRDARLINSAHQFAFSASLQLPEISLQQVKNSFQNTFKTIKPNLIARGNYKKMLYYDDLFN
jgi:hypothetical protein